MQITETSLLNYMETFNSVENLALEPIVQSALRAKKAIHLLYKDNPDQSLQEYTNKELRSKVGKSEGEVSSKMRIQFKDLETEIISGICQENLSTKDKMIEVGAGKLENGLSYLMQCMPLKLSKSIRPTDINYFHVKKSKALTHLDLCNMNKTFAPSSLDKILGSSVLDAISDVDLPVACKQIHATLKSGGLLLHFANMRPFDDTLLSSYRGDSHICFPWRENGIFAGLMRIERMKLFNFTMTCKKISQLARHFLLWYMELTSSEREVTINDSIFSKNSSNNFSNWIKALNPEGLEYINSIAFFENRTKKALMDSGFEIVEFGYRTASQIIDKNLGKEDPNYINMEFGQHPTETQIYCLKPDTVLRTIKMHSIIARKPTDM